MNAGDYLKYIPEIPFDGVDTDNKIDEIRLTAANEGYSHVIVYGMGADAYWSSIGGKALAETGLTVHEDCDRRPRLTISPITSAISPTIWSVSSTRSHNPPNPTLQPPPKKPAGHWRQPQARSPLPSRLFLCPAFMWTKLYNSLTKEIRILFL